MGGQWCERRRWWPGGVGVRAGAAPPRARRAPPDITDIDAFAVVDVAVAVVSAEAPPGLVEAATFSVTDAGELLTRL